MATVADMGTVAGVSMAGTVDLDELYAASYRRLVVQLYAICGDLSDAEDAVQEAFVTAIRKSRELARVGNPEAWVRTVALNRLRSGWRHASVVRKYLGAVPGPQADVEVGPEHVAIVAALARLDYDQRQVVVLHHLADLGTAEISFQLGIPEGTVKSRLARGRSQLGDLLTDREEPRHV
jgi:RNA polymerase sigma-70 factor (ECF subfamily)